MSAGALAVVALLGAVVVVPRGAGPARRDLAAAGSAPFGVTTATSDVLLLSRLNDASVVAWFEGTELCTAAIRVKRDRHCAPSVNPATPALFPVVLPADDASVRVDDRRLVAGLVRADVTSVQAELADGGRLEARLSHGRGFALSVFSTEVPRGAVVTVLRARGASGALLGSRRLTPPR